MSHVYDRKAPKLAVDLSLNRDLLDAAREAGINLSELLEEALAEKVAAAKREFWTRENSDAIAEYNGFVEKQGVRSDDTRSF